MDQMPVNMGFISVRAALAAATTFAVLRSAWIPSIGESPPHAMLHGSIYCSKSCDCGSPDDSNAVSIDGSTPGQTSQYDFGLVVAHCEEDYISWIAGAENITLSGDRENERRSTNWDVAVYERCGSEEAPEKYRRFQHNYGSEECTAYLKYIIDNYDSLPEIVYFLQSDAIVSKGDKEPHTRFQTLQEMVDASAPLLAKREKMPLPFDEFDDNAKEEIFYTGYVNVGNKAIFEDKRIDEPDPIEVVELLKEGAPPYDSETTLVRARSGACFGVRRESIQRNTHEFYKTLFLKELDHEDVRDLCYSLELLWHVVFGLPYSIPDSMLYSKL